MGTNNKIHYYIKTNRNLPITINNVDLFFLKKTNNIYVKKKCIKSVPIIHKDNDNIIDIYNYYKYKKNINLSSVNIIFYPISKNKVLSTTYLYFNKNKKTIKIKYLFNIPSLFLLIDFNKNKYFIYQKVPKYLKIEKQLDILKKKSISSIFKIDCFPYLQGEYYLNQNNYQFARHSLILGSSGSGKSKFISSFVNSIYKDKEQMKKYKVVIIDPHASIENDIGGLNHTKVIDFKYIESTISLFERTSEDYISQTEIFLSLFKNLIGDQYNSKLERVLRYSIYFLLLINSFDFITLRKLLLDIEFRSDKLHEYKMEIPVNILEFFLNDFSEIKTNFYGEAISPIISFIDEMQLLKVFSESNKELETLKSSISNNFLTIISLDRMVLGDKIIKTISGLVMQQLLGLVESFSFFEHIIFILDEISVIENPIVCRFLSEARKYNVSLFIAGQYLNQVSREVVDAIFANTINYYIFRISRKDACTLASCFDIDIKEDTTIEYKIKLLTELPNRVAIIRISKNDVLYKAMKGKTLDFISIPRIKKSEVVKKTINQEKKEVKFSFKSNISLNSILKETSTSREELK